MSGKWEKLDYYQKQWVRILLKRAIEDRQREIDRILDKKERTKMEESIAKGFQENIDTFRETLDKLGDEKEYHIR